MMEWSYGLLNAGEQHVLNQLAVFSGTFPLSGVEAVVGVSETPVLDVLDSLVAQSLVVPSVDSERFRLLETVRLYALDQLIATDEVDETRDKHLAWVLRVAGLSAWPDRLHVPGDNWQDEIDRLAEIDNIVAAMEWADQNNNSDTLLDLFRGTNSRWGSSGALARIGASWRDRIPQPPEIDLVGRAGWLSASGSIDYALGESDSAIPQVFEAATIVDTLIEADPAGDWFDSHVALFWRGTVSSAIGDIPAALLDVDRLDNLQNDPTGYTRWFSAHLKALTLWSQSNAESMAAAVASVDAARSVSEFAYAMAVSVLGTQLYRAGRHEEALVAILLCLETPALTDSIRVLQLPFAARPLTALRRYDEALNLIQTDFGPMLEAVQESLRVQQLLSLTIVLHGLEQIERRDQIAALSLKLGTNWDTVDSANGIVRDVLGTDEAVAALPDPDPADLNASGLTALISDTIADIRGLLAHRQTVETVPTAT